jgi:hypothetical protein
LSAIGGGVPHAFRTGFVRPIAGAWPRQQVDHEIELRTRSEQLDDLGVAHATRRNVRGERQQRSGRDDADVTELALRYEASELSARDGLPRHDTQADRGLLAVAGRSTARDGARKRFQRSRGVIGFNLKYHVEKTRRSPSSVGAGVVHRCFVGAECDGESQYPADNDDQILKDTVMLLADGPLTFLDECLNRRKLCGVLEQESAKSLSRRVKPWCVIEAAHEGEQFGKREAHWARNSTV